MASLMVLSQRSSNKEIIRDSAFLVLSQNYILEKDFQKDFLP